MTLGCAGCGREGVALIGGFCGMCSNQIAATVAVAIEPLSILDGQIHDVSKHSDGYIHIRIDPESDSETETETEQDGEFDG